MYLDDIIQWLKNTLKKYTSQQADPLNNREDSVQDVEAQFSEIAGLIFEFSENIIDKFYLSVLSGEYINYGDYDEKLEGINTLIGRCVEISPEETEVINSIKQIRSLITQYRHFIKRINAKYSRPDRIELFNSFTDRDDSFFYENSNNEIEIKCGLFKDVILGISYYDHNLSLKEDHDTFKDILFCLSRISETKEIQGPIKALSEAKCKILLYKLAKRIEQDEKKYYYTHNLSDKEFEIKDTIPTYYKTFIDEIDLQYYDDFENSKKEDYFIKYCTEILENNVNELSLTQSHALVKYYKDVHQNGEQVLQNLYEKVKKTSGTSDIKFNQRAKIVCYHYLLNNYFSFLIVNKDSSHLKIADKFKNINHRHKIDYIENYFPFLRYSEYLISQLEEAFSKDNIDTITCKDILDSFEQNFKTLMVKYEWCYDRDFLAFMPSFEECINYDTIEGQDYKLFIASSFVLPINYAQLKRNIDELYQKFNKYKLLLDLKLFQDKSNTELDFKIGKRTREFADIEERVKDSERKNIEILGIFAAIVLFTMANIQIFTEIEYIKDAILFMLIMAYCMSLFIVVIWLITRHQGHYDKDDDEKSLWKKTPPLHKYIIILLVAATLVSLFYTFPYFKSIKSDSREKKFEVIGSRIDSILEQNYKKDSIIENLLKKDTISK